eukprot:m51a1_g12119 hypothetical protein (179) ;mRNA; r:3539-5290
MCLRLYATRKGPEACYEAKVVLPGKPYRDELLRRFLLGHAEGRYVSHANGDTLDLRRDNLVVSTTRPTQPVERRIFGVPPGWTMTKKRGALHRTTAPNGKKRERSVSSIIKIEDVATFLEDRTNFEGLRCLPYNLMVFMFHMIKGTANYVLNNTISPKSWLWSLNSYLVEDNLYYDFP